MYHNGFNKADLILRQNKLYRGFIGLADHEGLSFFNDTWDLADTSYEAYAFYKQFQQVREAADTGKGAGNLAQRVYSTKKHTPRRLKQKDLP